MKRIITILVFFWGVLAVGAPNEAFEKGNQKYKDGDFEAAIASYEMALKGNEVSVALYYNLGNAYYQQGQLAQSILNYERAIKLNPSDEEVLRNIGIARNQLVDEIDPLPRPLLARAYRAVAEAFTPSGWMILGLWFFGGFVFLVVLLILRKGPSGRRPLFVTLGIILAVLSLVANGIGEFEANYLEENKAGIIMNANVYVKSGPDEDAEDLFVLHEGTKVFVREAFSGWLRVRLVDGKIGWIPKDSAEEI